MSGTSRPISLATSWRTATLILSGVAQKVTKPSGMKELRTIMIQSAFTNKKSVFFGADAQVTPALKAGGELGAGMTATLPLQDTDGSELWVIGKSGELLHVSYFDGGIVC